MLAPSAYAEVEMIDTWTINMNNADIRIFIEQVSDITGDTFVIGRRVKGKVTIISNADMSAGDILALFHSVLRVHGYTSIKSGSFYKIIPSQQSKQNALPLGADVGAGVGNDKSERMITQVVAIENTNAKELVPILRPPNSTLRPPDCAGFGQRVNH